ncbi:Serine/threonine-protein kinase RIO1 [Schistosoma japonicum]|uniref:Serine/threonine-protein kinase RIO1 n=1 Tax=Schistosoma japonicum TaxID=6182 RepID=A0A4Z2DSD7_SCHJA|nr:Serine/threonine-protein kinase RIO1 [Schistosoma japonicum]TNN19451.1 Serine/threonine-protein kinase RIO1 [Schistosoma japonicum]
MSSCSSLDEAYDDLDLSDSDNENNNSTKLYMQKFQSKVDLSMKNEKQMKDKSDRATTDHALDRRSCSILFKMMNQDIFSEVNGCISTGKEANIYHVKNKENVDFAIKVYMTSIMPFKSRDKYVKGDFRMRHGYSKSTSWKLVCKWSEKEYRNLLRINQSGLINAPKPLRLKGVVLLMTFVGKDGIPAPKLKDVCLQESDYKDTPDWSALYFHVIQDIRTLFQKCRLVHADLSEYNLLYLDGKVWMIDVSQAVEHESPQALEYLRTDCHNINKFFRKQGVSTLTLRELFEWVVNPSLPAPDDPLSEVCLTSLLREASLRGLNETIEKEDEAFRYVHIPRNLSVSYPFVRDFLKIQSGQLSHSDIYYAAITGLKPDLTGALVHPQLIKETEVKSDNEPLADNASLDLNKSSVSTSKGASKAKSIARPRDESPESRRNRKKAIKQEQAEKRKHKIPKYVKKRKIKK